MLVINGYRVDAVIREEHSHKSKVTSMPIEDGADTSDHNRIENDTLTVDGIVSDTPIGDIELLRDLDGADGKPSEEFRAHMLKLRDTRRPVTVVSSLAVYESMACTDFSPRVNPGETGGLFFSATFEKQRITVVQRVLISQANNLGNQPVKYFAFATDCFLHDLASNMWLDPDLTVSLRSSALIPTGYKRGVDVREQSPGFTESNGLVDFNVWRKSSRYDEKNRIYNCTKGPLRDGFYGTDAQIKAHVIGLTAEKRRDLIPPRQPASTANTKADLAKRAAGRKDKLRVFPNGDVGTISPSDPRWKDTKPFTP